MDSNSNSQVLNQLDIDHSSNSLSMGSGTESFDKAISSKRKRERKSERPKKILGK